MANEELKKIRDLAATPLKTEREMGRVELVMMVYNEHELVADVVGKMITQANYPFRFTLLDNTRQITPINFSRVWNDRIKKTECDFIAFMDSDIYVEQDWLKRMMSSFEDPSVDLVVPVMNNTSSAQQKQAAASPEETEEVLTEILAAQCVIYRTECFKKYGLFDERFLLYGQDSEWGYRFRKMGGKGIVRKDVWLNHLGSYSLKKFAEESKELYNAPVERDYARALFKYLTK